MNHAVVITPSSSNAGFCLTTLRNKAFPLVRYEPGDQVEFEDTSYPGVLKPPLGRSHTCHKFGSSTMSSAFLMDVISHRLAGVLDFQVTPGERPVLSVCLSRDSPETEDTVRTKLYRYTGTFFTVKQVTYDAFYRNGIRQKFSHVVLAHD
jgi:hypothetical protein